MKEISCLVGIQHMDKRIEYIYVNWNGHVDGVGYVLHNHFQNREKVLELIMTGSREELLSDDITPDMEKYKEAQVIENYTEYFSIKHPQYPIHYYYVFTLDGTWVVYDPLAASPIPVALFRHFGHFQ